MNQAAWFGFSAQTIGSAVVAVPGAPCLGYRLDLVAVGGGLYDGIHVHYPGAAGGGARRGAGFVRPGPAQEHPHRGCALVAAPGLCPEWGKLPYGASLHGQRALLSAAQAASTPAIAACAR